jgi:PAS domain S-box-containing protein
MHEQAGDKIIKRKQKDAKLKESHGKRVRPPEEQSEVITLHNQQEKSIIKRLEDELRSTKAHLESILVHSFDLILNIKKDGTIRYVNRQLDSELGYRQDELQGRHILEIVPDHQKEFILEKWSEVNEGISGTYETQLIKADGILMDCLISQSPAEVLDGFIMVIHNISDTRTMEHELLKIQSLESVSTFTGGFAHDFNNILTVILGNISLAKMYVMEKEVYNYLVEIEKASIRAKDLSMQLLTFSEGRKPFKTLTALDELIKDSTLSALKGTKVNCEFFIAPDLWNVEIDRRQISQAMNNLIIHAYHAMPNGGTINIQAYNVSLGSENMLALKAGDYIKISMRNQVLVISYENIEKIFDPSSTNKQDGGSLELATAYSIVKKHEGHITLESKQGFGTTFYIYLPASPEKLHIKKRDKTLMRGHGKVLVMDDEDMVRLVTGKMLYQLGYAAEFVKNGDEAITVYKKAKKSSKGFDAVIIDLTIPGGMGGKETIRKLIDVDPQVKAIVASGYAHDPVMSEYKDYGFCGAVPKPFTIEELGKLLQSIL